MPAYILICGKSGSGKSTIANCILQSNQFKVGHDLEQTTVTCENNMNTKYDVTELVGTGEVIQGAVTHEVALALNKKYLSDTKYKNYDIMLYILRSGRFDQGDLISLKEFLKIKPINTKLVMVFTGKMGWLKKNETTIRNLYPDTANIAMTEFDLLNHPNISTESLYSVISANMISPVKQPVMPQYIVSRCCVIVSTVITLLIILGIVIPLAVVLPKKHVNMPTLPLNTSPMPILQHPPLASPPKLHPQPPTPILQHPPLALHPELHPPPPKSHSLPPHAN